MGLASSLGGQMNGQPWLFKWRQFEAEIIVCAVRWYLRYSLSYREVKELLAERGINVDLSTMGPALRTRASVAPASSPEADQQELARGRNLRQGQGRVVLPVPSRRL